MYVCVILNFWFMFGKFIYVFVSGILPYHNGILGGISGILYECGPYMNCPKGVNCPQAITQAEIKIPLQVRSFKLGVFL